MSAINPSTFRKSLDFHIRNGKNAATAQPDADPEGGISRPQQNPQQNPQQETQRTRARKRSDARATTPRTRTRARKRRARARSPRSPRSPLSRARRACVRGASARSSSQRATALHVREGASATFLQARMRVASERVHRSVSRRVRAALIVSWGPKLPQKLKESH